MKVSINAAGRSVEIDCDAVNVTPGDIADKALSVWQATGNSGVVSDGPAYGFVSAERAGQRAYPSSSMRQQVVIPTGMTEDYDGYRVLAERSVGGPGVSLWLARTCWANGARLTMVAQPAELAWEQVDPAVAPGRATLHLDDGQGLALLNELARHYGGTGDSRTLRRDYDDERKRVDRLIGYLTR